MDLGPGTAGKTIEEIEDDMIEKQHESLIRWKTKDKKSEKPK